MEIPPPCITLRAQRRRSKCGGTEVLASCFSRVCNIQRPDYIGSVYRENNWTTERSPQQGLIASFDQRNGKASRKFRDSADGPSIGERFWPSQFVERQGIVVACHEIVSAIKSGQTAAQPVVVRIDLFAVARRIVE